MIRIADVINANVKRGFTRYELEEIDEGGEKIYTIVKVTGRRMVVIAQRMTKKAADVIWDEIRSGNIK